MGLNKSPLKWLQMIMMIWVLVAIQTIIIQGEILNKPISPNKIKWCSIKPNLVLVFKEVDSILLELFQCLWANQQCLQLWVVTEEVKNFKLLQINLIMDRFNISSNRDFSSRISHTTDLKDCKDKTDHLL